MTVRPSYVLIAGLALLAACSPKPAQTADTGSNEILPATEATPDANAPVGDIAPFMGVWRTVSSIPAPWAVAADPKPEANPEFETTEVTLTPTTSSGPGIVNCEQTKYEVVQLGPEGLFEGNLPEPAKMAAGLGFTGDKIATLREGCVSSTGDLELQFSMADPDTIMLGLDNIIYTMKRVTP